MNATVLKSITEAIAGLEQEATEIAGALATLRALASGHSSSSSSSSSSSDDDSGNGHVSPASSSSWWTPERRAEASIRARARHKARS